MELPVREGRGAHRTGEITSVGEAPKCFGRLTFHYKAGISTETVLALRPRYATIKAARKPELLLLIRT